MEDTLEVTPQAAAPAQSGPERIASVAQSAPAAKWVVYVTGAVRNPGVYEIAPQSRVYEALNAAGGFSSDADQEAINLAAMLTDGVHIKFPRKGEAVQPQASAPAAPAAQSVSSAPRAPAASGKININTASLGELDTLAGIGAEDGAGDNRLPRGQRPVPPRRGPDERQGHRPEEIRRDKGRHNDWRLRRGRSPRLPPFFIFVSLCVSILLGVRTSAPVSAIAAVSALFCRCRDIRGHGARGSRMAADARARRNSFLCLSFISAARTREKISFPDSFEAYGKILLARDWGKTRAYLIETPYGRAAAYSRENLREGAGVRLRAASFDFKRAEERGASTRCSSGAARAR